MSLYTIPYRFDAKHFNVVVVLSERNIERIKERDPAEILTREIAQACGTAFTKLVLKDVIITYATPEEMRRVSQLLGAGMLQEALKLLTRGYRYRPDENDGTPPEALPDSTH